MPKNKKKWLGRWPATCDSCGIELTKAKVFYDARTYTGSWGLLCPKHFFLLGVGLGLGKGQEYSSKTLNKLRG